MEKICLVSWRRKDRILGETETAAQRRAQMRENGRTSRWPLTSTTQALMEEETAVPVMRQEHETDMSAAKAYTIPEQTDEDLTGTVIPDILGEVRNTQDINEKTPEDAISSTIPLELNLEQSQALRTLPLTAQALSASAALLRCQLIECPHDGNVILRFSNQNQTEPIPKVEKASCAITSVMALKDVSEQLRLSRKVILRFVREGKLRHQRLAKRYVFMAEDVRAFRSQRLAAPIITME
jgi:hypothetical protein